MLKTFALSYSLHVTDEFDIFNENAGSVHEKECQPTCQID
jgi:hypothetical protein